MKALNRGIRLGLVIAAVIASCFSQAAFARDNTTGFSDKRILLLFAYHPSFPTSDKVLQGVRSVFSDLQPVIDIEYMDTKRLHDEQSRENFRTLLAYKLRHRERYDLVITVDDNALDFALVNGKTLFPDVPVVFLGVNDTAKAARQNTNPTTTGIVEASSFAETIALIRDLQPERARLNIIADGTPSGRADLQSVLALRSNFPNMAFVIHALDQLSWSEFAKKLEELGTQDAILLLSAYRDRDSVGQSFSDSLANIVRHTEAPIFHLWEHGLGDGIVGGILISHFEQGRQAAMIARRVLSGYPISEIPVTERSPNIPMFDSRQLERYEIADKELPEGSVVHFRTESILDIYQREIIGVMVVLLALVALSLYLGKQNVYRAKLAHELREKGSFLRLLMDTIPDLIWMKDPQGAYLSCNRRFEAMLGTEERDIIGKTDIDLRDSALSRSLHNGSRTGTLEGELIVEEHLFITDDGHRKLLETIKTPVFDATGDYLGVLGVGRDISQRRLAEEQIRILSQAIDQSPVSVMITDPDGNINYVNKTFERITGYPLEEIEGRTPRFLQSGETPDSVYRRIRQALTHGKAWEGELKNRKKNGETFWGYAHIAPVFDESGGISRYLAVNEDITLRKEQSEKILFQAHFDSLTKLPNRLHSLNKLHELIEDADHKKNLTAVLFIDLDDFKKINDSLGHETGDKLLVACAQRFRQCVQQQNTVGRLGGDEFIVLLGGLSNAMEAGPVAQNLLKQLQSPFAIEERELLLTASIGIAIYPDDGQSATDLLRKADVAMYHAKDYGRADYAFFTAELNKRVTRRFTIEQHLHGALDNREFTLFYQPQVEIKSGKIIGLEALLRWNNPTLGQVSPGEFIEIAEQNGSIITIGRFVLQKAMEQAASCAQRFGLSFTMAVNLSPRQFRDNELLSFIDTALAELKLPASTLELEITENVLMESHVDIETTLRALHEKGVRIALDDFGTGYSSLSYLRQYPFDTLKIDRSFTQGIATNPADRELVFATIAMAHNLGLKVVAEGVENQDQLNMLDGRGCELAQGYHFSRPLPTNDLANLLDGQSAIRPH